MCIRFTYNKHVDESLSLDFFGTEHIDIAINSDNVAAYLTTRNTDVICFHVLDARYFLRIQFDNDYRNMLFNITNPCKLQLTLLLLYQDSLLFIHLQLIFSPI